MNDFKLPAFSQENICTLLCFDEQYAQLVRDAVTLDLFNPGPCQVIARKAIDFLDSYKKPIKEHIADELEPYLAGDEGEKYKNQLVAIYTLRDSLNNQYVINRLTQFLKDKKFERCLEAGASLYSQGKKEEAQEVIRECLAYELTLFDPGIKLTDLGLLIRSLNDEDLLPTGVEVLDQMGVCPAFKQIIVFAGLRAVGKSWWQISLGKAAILHGFKVAHITLEISKEVAQQRYLQSLLGLARWQVESIKTPMIVRNGNGDFVRFDQTEINPRSLEDVNILDHISKLLKKLGPRVERLLRIKEFPSGSLNMNGLRTYLDGLERTQNFVPNLVIVDQPRNMKLDTKNYRLEIGQLYLDLRGLATERHCAVSAAHHTNRLGFKAKQQTGENISEDISIINSCDVAIFYNQKPMEHKYKRARLYVDRARSMRSQFTALITQDYDIGAFCTDSILLPKNYSITDDSDDEL